MADTLNNIGMGLMGLSSGFLQGLSAAQDRQLRRDMLAAQMQDRASNRQLQEMELAMKQAEFGMKQQERAEAASWMNRFPGFGGGGGIPPVTPVAPGVAQNKASALPQQFSDLLNYWGDYYGLTPEQKAVLPSIMTAESGGNQWAHNKANTNGTDDFGLMQINSSNLGRLAPGQNVFDPAENTRLGVSIFADALKRSGGDIRGALGAYNTGKVNPNAPYVDRVLGRPQPQAQGTQMAAGPTGTASDVPAGYGVQGGGGMTIMDIAKNPDMVNFFVAGAAHPNPQIAAKSKAVLDAVKAAKSATEPNGSDALKDFVAVNGRMPNSSELNAWIAQRKPSTNINIDNKVEGAERVERAKSLVKETDEIKSSARTAQDDLDNINLALSIPAETGALAPMQTWAGSVLAAFGVDPKTAALPEPSNQQAYSAAVNRLVLSRAESMKGALSDKDIAFLKQTVPGLGNTPEANRILLEAAKRIATRKIERAEHREAYYAEKGTYDGEDRAWREIVKGSSLFDGLSPAKLAQQNAPGKNGASAPPEGTRVRGKDGKTYVVKNGIPVPEGK